MVDSRRSPPADSTAPIGAVERVRAATAAAFDARVAPGSTVAVALSGGRDSMVLLDACAALAGDRAGSLLAIHVNHGLSPDADAWSAFCVRETAARAVQLLVRRVAIPRSPREGVEASARTERYRALSEAARSAGIQVVLLAHHQDDQAETLLLQLLRGAGPLGLSAMPGASESGGVLWLRPLLDVPRRTIDAYAKARGIAFVDDASNADPRHRRNAVRAQLAPAMANIFPGYPGTLARAARLQAEATRLADDLALLDTIGAYVGGMLDRARLASLPDHRARNLLRWFLRQHALCPPSEARLAAMLRQLRNAATDAQVRLAHDGAEIGVFRDRIVVHDVAPSDYAVEWRGEASLGLPHGRLEFVHGRGEGIALSRIAERTIVVRPRSGGERMALAWGRPRRALKSLFQEAGLPPWERRAWPALFCAESLVAVPGIGVDAEWSAADRQEGVTPVWRAASTNLGSPAL